LERTVRTGSNPNTTEFTYDRNGNQLTSVSTNGQTDTRIYNVFNQLIRTERVTPYGVTTTFEEPMHVEAMGIYTTLDQELSLISSDFQRTRAELMGTPPTFDIPIVSAEDLPPEVLYNILMRLENMEENQRFIETNDFSAEVSREAWPAAQQSGASDPLWFLHSYGAWPLIADALGAGGVYVNCIMSMLYLTDFMPSNFHFINFLLMQSRERMFLTEYGSVFHWDTWEMLSIWHEFIMYAMWSGWLVHDVRNIGIWCGFDGYAFVLNNGNAIFLVERTSFVVNWSLASTQLMHLSGNTQPGGGDVFTLLYNPPWRLSILLAFQVRQILFGGVVLLCRVIRWIFLIQFTFEQPLIYPAEM